jgi:hypothetical protein
MYRNQMKERSYVKVMKFINERGGHALKLPN